MNNHDPPSFTMVLIRSTKNAVPVYNKKPWKIFLSKSQRADAVNSIKHLGLVIFRNYSNHDPTQTFDRSVKQRYLPPYTSISEKYWKVKFLKTVKSWYMIFAWIFYYTRTVKINRGPLTFHPRSHKLALYTASPPKPYV